MKLSILIDNVVIQLKKVDINTTSADYLDATISFLMSISARIRQRATNVTDNLIKWTAVEYILEWIDSVFIKN